MYNNKRVAVILAAAGKGTRMGSEVPKQFLEIGGIPIIVKTLKTFQHMDEVDYIFVVTNREYVEHCRTLVNKAGITKVSSIVAGGKERQDSVYNALMEINLMHPGVEYVLIHSIQNVLIHDICNINLICILFGQCLHSAFCLRKQLFLIRINADCSDCYSR